MNELKFSPEGGSQADFATWSSDLLEKLRDGLYEQLDREPEGEHIGQQIEMLEREIHFREVVSEYYLEICNLGAMQGPRQRALLEHIRSFTDLDPYLRKRTETRNLKTLAEFTEWGEQLQAEYAIVAKARDNYKDYYTQFWDAATKNESTIRSQEEGMVKPLIDVFDHLAERPNMQVYLREKEQFIIERFHNIFPQKLFFSVRDAVRVFLRKELFDIPDGAEKFTEYVGYAFNTLQTTLGLSESYIRQTYEQPLEVLRKIVDRLEKPA